MRVARILIMCSTSLLVSQICAAQQPPATQPPQSANPAAQQNQAATAPSAASAAIPPYPDTPKGLEDLMNEMLKLEKKHDAKALAPYVASLELPNAAAWFRGTFGNEIGQELADSYSRTQTDLVLSFPDTLNRLRSQHFGLVHAVRFTDSCNENATDTEYPLLLRRVNQQSLYDVRLTNGSQMAIIRYFAFVDGAFRYLTSFQIPAPNFHSSNSDHETTTVKIGGNLMVGRIIRQVAPVYPEEERSRRVQGKVVLHALIGIDGKLSDLQVMLGTCNFTKSAINAVRQWQYEPYLLSGRPVKVDTTITVIFQMGQ